MDIGNAGARRLVPGVPQRAPCTHVTTLVSGRDAWGSISWEPDALGPVSRSTELTRRSGNVVTIPGHLLPLAQWAWRSVCQASKFCRQLQGELPTPQFFFLQSKMCLRSIVEFRSSKSDFFYHGETRKNLCAATTNSDLSSLPNQDARVGKRHWGRLARGHLSWGAEAASSQEATRLPFRFSREGQGKDKALVPLSVTFLSWPCSI